MHSVMEWIPLSQTDYPDAYAPVSQTDYPDAYAPVVVRFKEHRTNLLSSGSLLEKGTNYGYAVCVMRYGRDGFGNYFPICFVAVDIDNGTLYNPRLERSIPLNEVEAWARLN
jgi:hypothetical protein